MFYSTDVRHERFWRVGIARNAVFFRSFVASKARKGRSEKRGGAEDRLPKMSTKFAPRLRARAIWKSKSFKHQVLGTFLEVESVFRVAGAGISTRCKIRGRRRSSWGLQKRWQAWWIWTGSETMRFAWQAQWFRALWCRCLKPPTQNPWKGCKFHVTDVLLCSDHFAWQLQEFVCLGSTFSWQAQYFWSIHLKITKTYWNSEVKCLLNMSILKEVSQKCFVFELQSFVFEGSLAEKLRFSSWKLQFWRKSRRKASFLSFKATFLKEVSQKSFVFEFQSFIFEGSLRNASFLSFKASILKEVSQKSFVFHLESLNFEGSLAEMLRFWASKPRFWRKSRRKASFFDLQSFIFESQTDWQPNHLNLKSIDHQLTWISEHSKSKSFESHINSEPKSFESHIRWQPTHLNFQIIRTPHPLTLTSTDNQNHLNHTSVDNQLTGISDQLTTESLEVQINRQPHIDWQPNRLNLKSIDNLLNWSSIQQTTKIISSTHQFDTQNRLNLRSDDNQIIWLSTRLNLTSIDFRTSWTPHTPFL